MIPTAIDELARARKETNEAFQLGGRDWLKVVAERDKTDSLVKQLQERIAAAEKERERMREALTNLVKLYEGDEGCRALSEYVSAKSALSEKEV